MSTRGHQDSRIASPIVVPQFPRPFDGPQVRTVNPADTMGGTNSAAKSAVSPRPGTAAY